MIPPDKLTTFRRTRYAAAGVNFRIGQRSKALDGVLSGLSTRQAFMITAHNPGGAPRSATLNARQQERLKAALNGRSIVAAEGGAGRWYEPQILVCAPAGWIETLGRHFRQLALVRLRRGAAPSLVLLR